MTRLPPSARHAVRDLVAVLVIALVSCTVVALGTVAADPWFRGAAAAGLTTPSDAALSMGWSWTRGLAPWVLVTWCGTRARAGSQTRWVPAASAVGVVLVRTLVAVVPGAGLLDAWPGPVAPVEVPATGSWVLTATPAWGFPVLTAAALVAAAALGARDARTGDDAVSTHVEAVPSTGRALAAVVVGVPATVVTAGATAALLGASAAGTVDWVVAVGPLLTLVQAVLAAALLSGTGPSGLVAAGIAALPTAVTPVASWLAGGVDLLLVQATASLVACAVAVAWRPCTAWAAGALTPVGAPPPAPAVREPSS